MTIRKTPNQRRHEQKITQEIIGTFEDFLFRPIAETKAFLTLTAISMCVRIKLREIRSQAKNNPEPKFPITVVQSQNIKTDEAKFQKYLLSLETPLADYNRERKSKSSNNK
jgi:hypothetical protein